MRIEGFSYFINSHLQPYQLNNTTVVVDGQNIFYSLYEMSSLPTVLGSESDKFAKYVRNYLMMFKRNYKKCLFIMKGGHPDEHTFNVHIKRRMLDEKGDSNWNTRRFKQPVLAKDIFMQVLKEMDFDFTVCTTDVIKECFDLAQRLSCPVLSYNVQYCFSPAPYIPLKPGTHIGRKIFKRDYFLKKYNISLKKMILFILLTDSDIFEKTIFFNFFTSLELDINTNLKLYNFEYLLQWLSRNSETTVLKSIFKYISESNTKKFLKVKKELELKYLMCSEVESAASMYFTDKTRLEFSEQDPLWFQKGVALKYIAIPYINLHAWGVVQASRLIEDDNQENTILFSIDIIKYGFDLLQNFNGNEISVTDIYKTSNKDETKVRISESVSKPEYTAVNCVFENGWSGIKSRKLFEHFFLEKLGSFNFNALEAAPSDSRLLLIAMVYFTRNKEDEVERQIYSIMLSYVLLGVISGKLGANDKDISLAGSSRRSRPYLDNITDKDLVTTEDCIIAKNILDVYHNIDGLEIHSIFCRKKVHPLLQFERCLQEINYLNTLCGSPYSPTRYRNTYSATFIYKFLNNIGCVDARQSVTHVLEPATSVLAFTLGMIEIYKKILYGY